MLTNKSLAASVPGERGGEGCRRRRRSPGPRLRGGHFSVGQRITIYTYSVFNFNPHMIFAINSWFRNARLMQRTHSQ